MGVMLHIKEEIRMRLYCLVSCCHVFHLHLDTILPQRPGLLTRIRQVVYELIALVSFFLLLLTN